MTLRKTTMAENVDQTKINIAQNLKILLAERNMNNGDFERMFNLSQGIAGKYLNPKVPTTPKAPLLAAVAREFGVDLNTLILGKVGQPIEGFAELHGEPGAKHMSTDRSLKEIKDNQDIMMKSLFKLRTQMEDFMDIITRKED